MIRKAASKFMILTAATLASGALAVNCSKKSDRDDVGSVGLALVLPGGGIVNTVHYSINTTPATTGDIDVSAPGTTQATALVSGLLPGNYIVTMTATSSDMQTCSGMAPFTVAANQTAMANVILQCSRINNRGSVAITGRIDQCPLITSASATSLQAAVGGSISIGVVASELDPGDTLTYSWTMAGAGTTPGNGTFGAAAANTTFTCTAAGQVNISIAVSDGICGDSRMNAIPVNCLPGTTGTGGTGGTGVGGTGGTAGTTGVGGTAGTGVGGTGGTGGTAGTGGTGGTAGTGGTMCLETNPPANLAASCSMCLSQQSNPGTDGCCPIAATDPTGFQLCQAVSACMRSGQVGGAPCNQGGDVTSCYCGTNAATCDAATNGANGPCIAQFNAAAGRNIVTMTTDVPTPAQVIARQGDPNFALGRAANIQGVAGLNCPGECGF
jgi:hypothetical protein